METEGEPENAPESLLPLDPGLLDGRGAEQIGCVRAPEGLLRCSTFEP